MDSPPRVSVLSVLYVLVIAGKPGISEPSDHIACAPAEVHWRSDMAPSEVTSGVQDEAILRHVCDQLGLIGQFFTTPTAIMAGFGPLDQQHTFLIRVQPGELNLG